MKVTKRTWSTFMLMLIIAIVAAGCGGKDNASAGKDNAGRGEETKAVSKNNKDIVVAINANFITLDPHNTGDTHSISGARTMYEGLMGFDENMNVVPMLAASHTISEDGLVYTFTLKENIKFHDGTDFNAEAVKANLDRIRDEKSNLRLRKSFAKVSNVAAPDAKTVVITLSEPYNAFLNKMAMALMVSPKALKEQGDNIGKNPVGTGPFKFKEWVQGDRLVVVKNADYWQKDLPKVDSVTFKPVPENGSRIAMLKTGEADFIYPMPTEQVSEVQNQKDIVIDRIDSTIVRYVTLNTMKKPFDDVKVRQAINYAINKEAYIKVVKSGLGTKLDSSMSSKTQHYSKQTGYDYDVEKAKKLLAEAGYKDGFSAEIWGENDSETMKGMQFIQQQLALVGIKLEVKSMEGGTLSQQINSAKTPEEAKIQMWYVSWSPSSGDADGATRGLFSSEMFPPAGSNTAYYKNANVDKWIADANKAIDPKQAKAIYADIQKTIWEDAPWAFMGVDQVISGKRAYIDGVKVFPDGSINVRNAEVK
ncbi:glutathione transport system substrate-binding protein [Paenibacillus sp. UNCCL117]|uniref:glutathione ABC transporter substrate-binding protein n=1 Tax=unclassified Paenibacillus TaxID=185978 RepID=UPI000885436B|nr:MULTISPECIES: glutathione ABC transporter substrate-binding protein [unclassified Paenibacillus]SDC28538.1 glutathione transport system substrate-binding protein [Paenibacillus sp. cl123]SFW20572.1 glutathione transport system substrate-binding protein [Paenibacillus sp. UNCCL117]